MTRLSLAMIVKNEEERLAHSLGSVKDLVDEMVVLDTGSTDRTVEIARSFGAQVFPFTWQDDFSLARNAAISHCISFLFGNTLRNKRRHDLINYPDIH